MIKLLLLLITVAAAQNPTFEIDGQSVEVTGVTQIGNSITAAVLKNTQTLKVGHNSIPSVPAGTRLSFFKNNGTKDNLKLRGMIITEKVPDQRYTLKTNDEININCGRHKASAAFVKFSQLGHLLSGCHATTDQSLRISLQNHRIEVHKDSRLRFLENGLLKLASQASGELTLEGNLIELKPKTIIGFHDNGNIHFFHPREGSTFSFKTNISDHTKFYQPDAETTYPIFFHSNKNISSAFLDLDNSHMFSFEAFGTTINTELNSGPIGFDELGRINRTILEKHTIVPVTKPTYIRRTEQNTGATVRGLYPIGAQAELAQNTQVFLDTKTSKPVLQHYPELTPQGLAFLHELSYTPL